MAQIIMNGLRNKQREKLKENIADIIERGWHRGAPDSFPSTMAEKILQEVEKTYRKYDYQVTMEREKVQ